jgi:hypothetical protein
MAALHPPMNSIIGQAGYWTRITACRSLMSWNALACNTSEVYPPRKSPFPVRLRQLLHDTALCCHVKGHCIYGVKVSEIALSKGADLLTAKRLMALSSSVKSPPIPVIFSQANFAGQRPSTQKGWRMLQQVSTYMSMLAHPGCRLCDQPPRVPFPAPACYREYSGWHLRKATWANARQDPRHYRVKLSARWRSGRNGRFVKKERVVGVRCAKQSVYL